MRMIRPLSLKERANPTIKCDDDATREMNTKHFLFIAVGLACVVIASIAVPNNRVKETSAPQLHLLRENEEKSIFEATEVDVMERIFFYGDSLTAGAFHAERSGKLELKVSLWWKAAAAELTRRRPNSHPSSATGKGFPGKDSRMLLAKLRKLGSLIAAAKATVVVIMSGTNDCLGLKGDMSMESLSAIEQMHSFVHQELKLPTIALLLPPMNFSTPRELYGQTIPRGYCEGKRSIGDQIIARRRKLQSLLHNSMVVGHCLHDWEEDGQLFHNDTSDIAQHWADCIHPNRLGYKRFGRIAGEMLARRPDKVCR